MTTFRDWMEMPKDVSGNLREEFCNGVQIFLNWAFSERGAPTGGKIRCPCKRCANRKYKDMHDVTGHLFRCGFTSSYRIWIYHGETVDDYGYEFSNVGESSNAGGDGSDSDDEIDETPLEEMLQDLFPDVNMNGPMNDGTEEPNPRAKHFYEMYVLAQKKIYPGNDETILGFASGIMASKTAGRASEYTTNLFLQNCKVAAKTKYKDRMPENYQAIKSIMMKLGMSVVTYDVCENHCFLYYKEGENHDRCPTCGNERYKPRANNMGTRVANKKIWYFPVTERLQRLYMSRTTAEHMTWHSKCTPRSEKVIHPAASIAWAHFNETFPDFASEIRNVRLGLSSDGFDPKHGGRSHFVWPVFVTPYNLPPHLAMRSEFIFLSILIPGPKSPGVSIDVMLRPLIDELIELWTRGALTYDCYRKQNFIMRAAVMWTISDFPAYGMLSGWSTHGKMACPCCMQNTDTIYLKHGGKPCWFDCHRKFLPRGHAERRNKNDYRKDRVVTDIFPERMPNDQVTAQVMMLPKNIPFGKKYKKLPGKGVFHNWTKRIIFYELPYWPYLLVRHNLDVMHTERNFFENIKLTSFDEGKNSRDSLNARKDLKIWTKRSDLFLEDETAKTKPKSTYTLKLEEKLAICNWLQSLRFPDGHAGNIGSGVRVDNLTISGMKSHDCHVFMQRLIPIAFRGLVPENVWEALTEVSNFFRAICASEISPNEMYALSFSVVQTLCKLEKIYPPSFFDSMEHLIVHLPYEAMVMGPVFYRWMYPFERMMWLLKNHSMNMNHMEGSIVQAYLQREVSNFTAFYFGRDVQAPYNRMRRNERPRVAPLFNGQLSICVPTGVPIGKAKCVTMGEADFNAAILYIVRNCPEFDPYVLMFDAQNNVGISSEELEIRRVNFLVEWLRLSHRQGVFTLDPRLELLLFGASRRAITYSGYNCNGARWHTYDHGLNRKTMCSGVTLMASGIDYYGMLRQIVEISFNAMGWPQQTVVLFKCDWYDHVNGANRHPKYGIVEIDSRKCWNTRECFILSAQASQVYYAPYPCSLLPIRRAPRNGWWVVCPTRPRHIIDTATVDEVEIEEETEYFEDPAPPTINLPADDLSTFNVRNELIDLSTGQIANSDDDGVDEPGNEDEDEDEDEVDVQLKDGPEYDDDEDI